jgi:hypothetical protein
VRDYVLFLKDVDEDGEVVFKKGEKYEVLDENKDSYFIQRIPQTNQVSQFDKKYEGKWFKF